MSNSKLAEHVRDLDYRSPEFDAFWKALENRATLRSYAAARGFNLTEEDEDRALRLKSAIIEEISRPLDESELNGVAGGFKVQPQNDVPAYSGDIVKEFRDVGNFIGHWTSPGYRIGEFVYGKLTG